MVDPQLLRNRILVGATIYSTVTQNKQDAGKAAADALAAGLSRAAIVMAVFSALGLAMALLMGRHRPRQTTERETAAATAAHSFTIAADGREETSTPV